jgi:hypothetical protein
MISALGCVWQISRETTSSGIALDNRAGATAALALESGKTCGPSGRQFKSEDTRQRPSEKRVESGTPPSSGLEGRVCKLGAMGDWIRRSWPFECYANSHRSCLKLDDSLAADWTLARVFVG